MDDVADFCLTGMSVLAPAAAEAVYGEVVHCGTLMRTAERCAKSEAHSDTGGLVVYPKSQGHNRKGVQPCTGFLPTGG